VFGGVSERPQIDGLRQGCDLLIATPGRLLDLVEQRAADLSQVRHLVLDEADRMLDMGFIHAIRRIIRLLPAERQNLMFSATYSDDIRDLASRMLKNPITVEVASRNTTAERVEQVAFKVPKEHKRHLLVHLFESGAAGEGAWHQALVFTRTKHGANRLAQQLEAAGIRAAAIHGNKSQAARVRALSDFKDGKIAALVATEVASRGLDIKELPQVVNYELPNVPEDYVHRIGRTARAGATGRAVSLVSADETGLLRDIERTMRQSVPVLATPAFKIVESRPAAAAGGAAARGEVNRPNASPGNRAGSAPRRAGHGGRPGSRSHHSGPSRRNRSAF
jgi:ATP-dependent RNA helicase RhlE